MSVCKEEIQDTLDLIQNEYDKRFADKFSKVKSIYKQMRSELRPINDSELTWVLVELPMTLFDVSEQVSQLKAAYEVVKLTIKEKEATYMQESTAKTATEKKAEAEVKLTEYKVDLIIYQNLIQRVDNELDLARELIMGCKKIFDSRRKTEQSNPVSVSDCPTYNKTPIFGSEGKS